MMGWGKKNQNNRKNKRKRESKRRRKTEEGGGGVVGGEPSNAINMPSSYSSNQQAACLPASTNQIPACVSWRLLKVAQKEVLT